MATTISKVLRRSSLSLGPFVLRSNGSPPNECSCVFARSLCTTSLSVRYGAFKQADMWAAKELYRRRQQAGPEPLRHRNIWQNWNYESELYAFGRRLGENFSNDTIRLAFMHPSFAEQEAAKRKELMIDDLTSSFPDQTQLKLIGSELAESHILAFVRYNFPYFPEEGVRGVASHLLSPNLLATVSFCLGTSDLIMCADLPPERETLVDTLYAVIGALTKDNGPEQAAHFIQDFIITQMLTEDVNDYLILSNPMGALVDILRREGRAEPEPRLLRQAGQSTVFATYLVGVYSDKKLIGESFGETLLIAEDVAARDALRRLFRTDPRHRPWLCGNGAKNLPLRSFYDTPNVFLKDWTQEACEENLKNRLSAPSLEEPRRALQ